MKQLKVSPDGSRLAILFADSELVALFRVQRKSKDFLFPVGFIRGYQNEYPVALDFQRNLKKEAVMTIVSHFAKLFSCHHVQPEPYMKLRNITFHRHGPHHDCSISLYSRVSPL